MDLIRALILFLVMLFALAVIGYTWGWFWAFVMIVASVVGAYEEWTKK